ncbi:rho1 guanine nucleotide exchange factor 3 [Colletotrichum incanum]|nr:rho1 guanine nucleotide exchange factor 3 [Colletotrichum incanum]
MAGTISDQFALAIFDLNENELLIVYERCAVYLNKWDCKPSRPHFLYFLGRVQNVTKAIMHSKYLLLFTDQYIEIRVAETGELRQFIPGSYVRFLGQGKFHETLDKESLYWIVMEHRIGRNPLVFYHRKSCNDVVRSVMALPEYPDCHFIFDLLLREEPTDRPG